MQNLGEQGIFIFVAQLGVIIFVARFCGEIAKRFGQPILAGEVVAGILLGPLIFGKLFPGWREVIFPSNGVYPYLLGGISWLCAIFLLLITGLEVDFGASVKYGKQNILTSFFGFFLPFLLILSITFLLPKQFYPQGVNPFHVNLLIATALSVASVPVIGKILFDLKIFHSNVGLNIITSSVLSDIWEWSTLLVVIALVTKGSPSIFIVLKPIVVMLSLLAIAVTMGQRTLEGVFRRLGIKVDDTAAILALLFSVTLLNGAITHLLGIHVAFGAFLTGLMIGESQWITPHMRQSIQDFIFGVFAPIFFVLIGMQLQLGAKTSWLFILLLMFVASIGKVGGAFLGAYLGGIGRKNALAVGCGLNTPGAMGIIVALIGTEMGIFNDDVFSAIVVICIALSLFVGPTLKWAIKSVRRPLAQFFNQRHIFVNVPGSNKTEVLNNMVGLIANRGIIEDKEKILKAIWEREESLSTAIGEGIALPHARIPDLKTPIVCFFKLANPVDFKSPDNVPVQLLFLELTNSNDGGMQLNLIAQITRFLSSVENRRKLMRTSREEDIYHILSYDEKI